MLTLLNKHLQTIKRAKQVKNIYNWYLNANAKKKEEVENEICLYDY